MSSNDFENTLNEALDNRQDLASEEIRQLAQESADCRKKWERYLKLQQAIGPLRDHTPQVDLVDKVLARYAFEDGLAEVAPAIRQHQQHAVQPSPSATTDPAPSVLPSPRNDASPRSRGAIAAFLLAAAALCLVWAPLFRTSTDRLAPVESAVHPPKMEQPTPRSIAKTTQGDGTAAVAEDAPIDDLVRDVGSAYLGLASGAAEAAAEASVLVVPRDGYRTLIGLDGVSRTQQRPWTQEWERELQPIGRRFSQAFDFLLDAVPADAPPAT